MSCRRHALYLSEDEGRQVQQVLRDHGYVTHGRIAERLVETRMYAGRANLHRSFISMALRGKRGLPEAMIYGLVEIVGQDDRLHFLLRGTSPIQPTPKDHWEGLLLEYVHRIKEGYDQADPPARLAVLSRLEEAVNILGKGTKGGSA